MTSGRVESDLTARVGNFIHTIDRLCRRPARGEGVQDSPHVPAGFERQEEEPQERPQHTGRRGIPIMRLRNAGDWPEFLVRDADAARPVISARIRRSKPEIAPGDTVPVILARIVADLGADAERRSSADGKLRRVPGLRFPRYRMTVKVLAAWTARHADAGPDAEEAAREALRAVDRTWGWGIEAAERGGENVPFPFNVLLSLAPPFLHDWRLSGRAPLLSGRLRALRSALAKDTAKAGLPALLADLDPADSARVDRLLLSAFLDDLSRQYRRTPLHVRGAGHVFYPLLLLNEHGGELVELIAERRADLESFDPVVVVTYLPGEDPPSGEEEDPVSALIRWRRELVASGRAAALRVLREPLDVRAPGLPKDPVVLGTASRFWVPPSRKPPWWSTPLAIALFWSVLAGAAGAYAGQTVAWQRTSCATGLWAPWAESGRQLMGAECVGVAEPGYLFTPSTPEIAQVHRRIHQENLRAAALHEEEAQAARPYVTIVYLAALTSGNRDSLAAVREGLAGVAIAQKNQNDSSGASEPIVRLLVANGGGRMQHGEAIARLLVSSSEAEAPIVGVVGLDQSRQQTVATIHALGKAGLPMVASTLSADRLVEESPFYFQVAPQNRRQAAVAAAFATTLGLPRRARVYYSHDVSDYYSDNLRKQVAARFAEAGFAVESRRFTPIGSAKPGPGDPNEHPYAGEPRQAGVSACDAKGLVYFAGRGIPDFQSFIKGVNETCPGAPPAILAGDDITRYAADVRLRAEVGQVPFYYQSFAVAPNRCGQPQPHDFYDQLFRTFTFECQEPGAGRTLDGHAALSYDAAETLITAIRRLGGPVRHAVPVNSYTVWRQLSMLHTSSGPAIQGATGGIDFGGGTARQYPRDKPVLILRVKGAERPEQVGACGPPAASSSWCSKVAEKYR
ncbi:hypothetical protein ACIBEJ_35945 [Nonomuraea sp. NPDC050790]|uniref:hypothetical protein n=1 Tax=Nonomuraea sp. NPDC050790 TaxID=3364371 RepID=UPI0037BC1312